jgi:hypothetical protein
MKTVSLFCLFCSFFYAISAQNYADADPHALGAPASASRSIPELSKYLCGPPMHSDEERLRAIYAWITQNIAYVDSTDGKELWSKPADIRRQRPDAVLRNRTAVCLGYANLFQALATAADIPCEVISGIVREPDGEVARIGHAWVAAKAGRGWHLFDPTWGIPSEGRRQGIIDERYFMADPKEFVLYHLPDDPMWQMIENPLHENHFKSESDAALRARVSEPAANPFYYKDTLSAWLRLDSTARPQQSVYRILRFNEGNERVIFQLGRTFYKNFFELKYTLDSISVEYIFKKQDKIDSTRFIHKIALLEQYHRRAGELFAQLRSPDRIERAGRMFSAEQMNAIVAKMRGDMYMALFQYRINKESDINTEKQLQYLQGAAARVEEWHNRALPGLTVDSLFGDDRRNIWNVLSIKNWLMGNRYLRLAQNHISDAPWQRKNAGALERAVETGRRNLLRADSITCLMFTRPWYVGTLRERLTSIRKSLITAEVLDVRLAQQAWKKQVETLTERTVFSEKDIRPVQNTAKRIREQAFRALDSLAHAQHPYEEIFVRAMHLNLHSDLYETHLHEGDLWYRLCIFTYNQAIDDKATAERRKDIVECADRAINWFDRAGKSLSDMEKTGNLDEKSKALGRKQVAELKKAAQEMRDRL